MQSTGVSCSQLQTLPIHQSFIVPPTQLDFYIKKGAAPDILKYVALQGKTFGEKYMEPIAHDWFKLEKRTSSIHDHSKNGKTIEQKSARYHANGDDWKWQHIEMKHDWDVLLLTGLDFDCIRFYVASRDVVIQLITEGIVTGQGKKNEEGIAEAQQAYWFSRSDFRKKNKVFTDYFVEISTEADLCNYLDTLLPR
jgi:hypothetical protein